MEQLSYHHAGLQTISTAPTPTIDPFSAIRIFGTEFQSPNTLNSTRGPFRSNCAKSDPWQIGVEDGVPKAGARSKSLIQSCITTLSRELLIWISLFVSRVRLRSARRIEDYNSKFTLLEARGSISIHADISQGSWAGSS